MLMVKGSACLLRQGQQYELGAAFVPGTLPVQRSNSEKGGCEVLPPVWLTGHPSAQDAGTERMRHALVLGDFCLLGTELTQKKRFMHEVGSDMGPTENRRSTGVTRDVLEPWLDHRLHGGGTSWNQCWT